MNAAPGHPVLVHIPFRQITERGLTCVDDNMPIRCIVADEYFALPVAKLEPVPETSVHVGGLYYTEPDGAYASVARRVINDEIGQRAGSNFVIRRDLLGKLSYSNPDDRAAHTLAVWRRLLDIAHGAYWLFGVQFPDLTLIGASPERHLTMQGPVAEMTPISGTFRYPVEGDALPALHAFLYNRKEVEELDMVVDEEFKMMTKACAAGVALRGPFPRMMDQLAHTEY
jgi:phenazine biosynthesis protein phzE